MPLAVQYINAAAMHANPKMTYQKTIMRAAATGKFEMNRKFNNIKMLRSTAKAASIKAI